MQWVQMEQLQHMQQKRQCPRQLHSPKYRKNIITCEYHIHARSHHHHHHHHHHTSNYQRQTTSHPFQGHVQVCLNTRRSFAIQIWGIYKCDCAVPKPLVVIFLDDDLHTTARPRSSFLISNIVVPFWRCAPEATSIILAQPFSPRPTRCHKPTTKAD